MSISRSIALLLVAASFVGYDEAGSSTKEKEADVIVFRGTDGRTLTLDELREVTGTYRYEIVGSDDIPGEAEALHNKGREAGRRGDHETAVSLLSKASKLAPRWPYPVYDRAFTHLLMKDFDAARVYYQRTVELAPRGFFTAITALDALDREANGDLPQGTYLAFLSLEWIDDPVKKADAVHQLVQAVPNFAPAWEELAKLTEQDVKRLAAIERGLDAQPDAETRGMLLINKALVLERQGSHEEAVRLLGELALASHSTSGIEHLAKTTLAFIAQR